jgi:hypothetical protein
MTDLADLERRVIALEAANNESVKTLQWLVGTAGRIAADVASVGSDVKALRDDLRAMDRRLSADVAGLRKDLPGLISDAVRAGLASKP